MDNVGQSLLEETPDIRSKYFSHVMDLDLGGAYPNGEIMMNISKETTLRELCRVVGVTERKLRRACINQTAARINAVEICQDILHAPKFEDLLEGFVSSNQAV